MIKNTTDSLHCVLFKHINPISENCFLSINRFLHLQLLGSYLTFLFRLFFPTFFYYLFLLFLGSLATFFILIFNLIFLSIEQSQSLRNQLLNSWKSVLFEYLQSIINRYFRWHFFCCRLLYHKLFRVEICDKLLRN